MCDAGDLSPCEAELPKAWLQDDGFMKVEVVKKRIKQQETKLTN